MKMAPKKKTAPKSSKKPSSFGGSDGKKLTKTEGRAMAKGNVFRADKYGRRSFGVDAEGGSQGAKYSQGGGANYPGRISAAAEKQLKQDKEFRKRNPSPSSAQGGKSAPKKKAPMKGSKY